MPLGARGKMNPKLSRLWASYGLGKIPWSQWSPGLNCYKVIMEQENDRMLVRWCSQWRSWENSSSSLFHSCSSRFTWWTNHGHHKNCTSSQRRKRFFFQRLIQFHSSNCTGAWGPLDILNSLKKWRVVLVKSHFLVISCRHTILLGSVSVCFDVTQQKLIDARNSILHFLICSIDNKHVSL